MSKTTTTEKSQDMMAEAGKFSLISPASPECVEKLYDLIHKGIDLQTACAAVMVNYKTFLDCLVDGMNDAAEDKMSLSSNLYLKIKKAMATRSIYLNNLIEDCLEREPKLVFRLLQLNASQRNKPLLSTFDEFIINESNNFRKKIIEKERIIREEIKDKVDHLESDQYYRTMKPFV
jgi:hypothetical protein